MFDPKLEFDTQTCYSFPLPTRVEYGPLTACQTGQIASEYGAKSALLVTDEALAELNMLTDIEQSLADAKIKWKRYVRTGEPTDAQVDKGAAMIKEQQPDVIIAVGGGSALDTAKAMLFLAANDGSIIDYNGINETGASLDIPLIAIATTAGTGADFSAGAVITDTNAKFKMCICHESMSPDVAIVDPVLYYNLPPDMTAWSGCDALAQAIGAMTATCSQPLADAMAIYAIELIGHNLPIAYANTTNKQQRTNMMIGSTASAIAMSSSDVVIDHVLGEVVGGFYSIPHGLTIGVFTPAMMEYNKIAVPEKMARIAQALGEDISGQTLWSAADKAVASTRRLMHDLDIPTAADIGIKETDIPELARRAMRHLVVECNSNPRPATESDYIQLYQQALADTSWL